MANTVEADIKRLNTATERIRHLLLFISFPCHESLALFHNLEIRVSTGIHQRAHPFIHRTLMLARRSACLQRSAFIQAQAAGMARWRKKRDQLEEGRKLIPASTSNGGRKMYWLYLVYNRKIKKRLKLD
jgi:hypothetical protein